MADGDFPIDSELTVVAINYRNRTLIADQVIPDMPVGLKSFQYTKYNIADGFTIPDTRVGAKSELNIAEFGGSVVTDSVEDFGLQDKISNDVISNAPANVKPLDISVEKLSALIALDKEVRTAGVIFNASNYASTNKVTLSGTSQYSDYDNSNPYTGITGYLDSMIMRANSAVMGRDVYAKLARHPKILEALGKKADGGVATVEELATLFELSGGILVGEGYVNTARKGQAMSLTRVWGKHISLMYKENAALVTGGLPTFCFRAAYGEKVAGKLPDEKMGLRGGTVVKVGESCKEVICSDILGFFIQNAVA